MNTLKDSNGCLNRNVESSIIVKAVQSVSFMFRPIHNDLAPYSSHDFALTDEGTFIIAI